MLALIPLLISAALAQRCAPIAIADAIEIIGTPNKGVYFYIQCRDPNKIFKDVHSSQLMIVCKNSEWTTFYYDVNINQVECTEFSASNNCDLDSYQKNALGVKDSTNFKLLDGYHSHMQCGGEHKMILAQCTAGVFEFFGEKCSNFCISKDLTFFGGEKITFDRIIFDKAIRNSTNFLRPNDKIRVTCSRNSASNMTPQRIFTCNTQGLFETPERVVLSQNEESLLHCSNFWCFGTNATGMKTIDPLYLGDFREYECEKGYYPMVSPAVVHCTRHGLTVRDGERESEKVCEKEKDEENGYFYTIKRQSSASRSELGMVALALLLMG